MDKTNKYQPGVCNIGPEEIESRRRMGIGGALAALLWSIVGSVLNFSILMKLLVFIPAFVGVVGLLQVYFKFCAAFGLASVFNFGSASDDKNRVLEEQARALDARQAWKIISISLGVSLVYTVISAFLL